MRSTITCGAILAVGLGAAACGDNHVAIDAGMIHDGTRADARPIDATTDADPLRPMTLAGTGLCVDDACTQIAADVHEYEPRWPLWADGATKRRWIYLPPGTTIDTTTDPDYWVFPIGTKMWKEFTQDGVRVETRYIVNTGVGFQPWFYMPYQWNAANTATTAVPDGVIGANGTIHDIPSQHQCENCHENTPNKVLGFGALQLDFTQTTAGLVDLDGANTLGWLDAAPPVVTAGTPHYPLPAGTGVETPALGYLHANCSHCHNPHSTVHDITPMEMHWLLADRGAFTDTSVYKTTIGATVKAGTVDGDTIVVDPMDAAHSVMVDRISTTNLEYRMPALGSNVVDPTGVSTITAWIQSLPTS